MQTRTAVFWDRVMEAGWPVTAMAVPSVADLFSLTPEQIAVLNSRLTKEPAEQKERLQQVLDYWRPQP